MAVDPEIKRLLEGYSNEVEAELVSILDWWTHHIHNPANCFYYGEINNKNEPDAEAPIGLVLQSRLLWTFSAAFKHTQNHQYLKAANHAYDALVQKFYDNKNTNKYNPPMLSFHFNKKLNIGNFVSLQLNKKIENKIIQLKGINYKKLKQFYNIVK